MLGWKWRRRHAIKIATEISSCHQPQFTGQKVICIHQFSCLYFRLQTGSTGRKNLQGSRFSNLLSFIAAKVIKCAAGVCGRKPLCVSYADAKRFLLSIQMRCGAEDESTRLLTNERVFYHRHGMGEGAAPTFGGPLCQPSSECLESHDTEVTKVMI